jgi:Alkaline phosphatase PhoX
MKPPRGSTFTVLVVALSAVTGLLANTITGPSSSQSPYIVRSQPGVVTKAIMTVGDSVNLKPDGMSPYRMVGLADGLGAFDNHDGTFTLLMNHEIDNNLGATRAHGRNGAFVSRWIINTSDLSVVSVRDFISNTTSVFLSNNVPASGTVHSGFLPGNTTAMARLCSADLGAPTAHRWTDPATGLNYGTDALIFQSGEETGGTRLTPEGPEARIDFGRQFAFIATDDSNIAGNQANTAYELPHAGLFQWENNLVNPLSQRKTIVMGMDDSTPGQVYVWVGDKQTTGNVVERAGLTRKSPSDNLYVIKVNGLTPDATGATNEDRAVPLNGTFSLENEGDVSGLTGAGLETLTDSKGATQFLRPEDGQWDPSNPEDFYFVTTDRYDQVKDGVGAQVGRSRLYRLRFRDISRPELGGTIEAMLDGTEAGNMFDNMTINRRGHVLLQEDVGAQEHPGKIWQYDIATGVLTEVARHDPERFGDIGVPATSPFNQDEESSGIIDVSSILGEGWYLLDVQAHYPLGGELVEGGQLLALHIPPGKKFK